MHVSLTRIRQERLVDIPLGDILETGGRVGALGGINVGGNLLLDVRVDGVVDENDVDSGGIGAVWG